MHDISNKLHALVDEFVSNLSSECDSLANNICSQAGKYEAGHIVGEAAPAPRLSNRTTLEVLKGLRRPYENPLTNTLHRDKKTHTSHDSCKNGRSRNDMASIGKSMEHIEILSSNQSSDDCCLANMKSLKGRVCNRVTQRLAICNHGAETLRHIPKLHRCPVKAPIF